jgi:predicted nuclease of predicted toxin-antitoxin system
MRFLVDESTGPAVAEWLRQQGHDVFSVYDEARGMDDNGIIQKASTENWILVTNDKDFGEKVYRKYRCQVARYRSLVRLAITSFAALLDWDQS